MITFTELMISCTLCTCAFSAEHVWSPEHCWWSLHWTPANYSTCQRQVTCWSLSWYLSCVCCRFVPFYSLL